MFKGKLPKKFLIALMGIAVLVALLAGGYYLLSKDEDKEDTSVSSAQEERSGQIFPEIEGVERTPQAVGESLGTPKACTAPYADDFNTFSLENWVPMTAVTNNATFDIVDKKAVLGATGIYNSTYNSYDSYFELDPANDLTGDFTIEIQISDLVRTGSSAGVYWSYAYLGASNLSNSNMAVVGISANTAGQDVVEDYTLYNGSRTIVGDPTDVTKPHTVRISRTGTSLTVAYTKGDGVYKTFSTYPNFGSQTVGPFIVAGNQSDNPGGMSAKFDNFDFGCPGSVFSKSHWAKSGGQAPEEINSVKFGAKIYQVTRDVNRYIYMRESADGGSTWTVWTKNGGQTPMEVTMAVFNNKLYQTTVNVSGNIFMRNSTDGTTWTAWAQQTGTSPENINMVVFSGRLYQATRDVDRYIWMRSSADGTTWSDWVKVGGQTPMEVNMEVFGGKLYQVTQDIGRYIFMRSCSANCDQAGTWPIWTKTGGQTPENVNMVACNSRLFQTTRDINNRVFVRNTTDGTNWEVWKAGEGVSAGEVTMVCNGTKLLQTLRDPDRYIWMRFFNV